jgi:hypothetical protein
LLCLRIAFAHFALSCNTITALFITYSNPSSLPSYLLSSQDALQAYRTEQTKIRNIRIANDLAIANKRRASQAIEKLREDISNSQPGAVKPAEFPTEVNKKLAKELFYLTENDLKRVICVKSGNSNIYQVCSVFNAELEVTFRMAVSPFRKRAFA